MKEIVCFGEVLWDVFPDGTKIIGGAPLNVALHWINQGGIASIISKVGADLNGQELINHLEQYDRLKLLLDKDKIHPTGIVQVNLDDNKNAKYHIEHPSAWDYIELKKEIIETCKNADALIFGSLSSRSHESKKTLLYLLEISKYNVFDVNLRAPFYSKEVIVPLLNKAHLIKLNEEELPEVLKVLGHRHKHDLSENLRTFAEITETESICLTLGERGAILYFKGSIYYQQSYKIDILDTVGAGDSFLSALVHGILNSNAPEQILKKACAVGAIVASSKGATPYLNIEEIDLLINKEEC